MRAIIATGIRVLREHAEGGDVKHDETRLTWYNVEKITPLHIITCIRLAPDGTSEITVSGLLGEDIERMHVGDRANVVKEP